MKKLLLATTLALLIPITTQAQNTPEQNAQGALDRFINAWNTGDNAQLQQQVHYPFLSLFGPGNLHIATEPEQFTTNYDQMRQRNNWHHSMFTAPEIIVATQDQIHLRTTYTRYNINIQPYQSGNVYYIITKKDDHWAIQFRSPVFPDAKNKESEAAADKVIADFFTAWNAADNPAMHKTVNFPHAFLVRNAQLGASQGPDQLITDFEAMRRTSPMPTARSEGWHHSQFKDLQYIFSDPTKVLALLTFTRHHDDGTIYRTVPVLWIITKQNEHWGIQLRAILPAIPN